LNSNLDLQSKLLTAQVEKVNDDLPLDLDFIRRLFQVKEEGEPGFEDVNVYFTPVNVLFSLVVILSSYLYLRLD